MFQRAQITRIEQLHQTGRQLAVLKRMYQSYAIIIERILSRQKPTGSNHLDAVPEGVGMHARPSRQGPESQHGGQESQGFGAPLTSKAVVKFERLKDRINLYALSEIQDCLDEKESLVFLNFNLMTMRQSGAVERLTRITILLAKVTILFMPVSLMTGYFSVQIADLEGVYTAKTYWVCFAVIKATNSTPPDPAIKTMRFGIVLALSGLSFVTAQSPSGSVVTGKLGDAAVTENNPLGVRYTAVLPETNRTTIRGSISATSNANGTGVNFYVDFYGFPSESLGPFSIGAFFGNRSIVVHTANTTRLTCANFVLTNGTASNTTNVTTGTSSPNIPGATSTTSVPFTGGTAMNFVGASAIVGGFIACLAFLL
ncbi:MAG: hypothetical protein Q9163_001199 [Psora crenata]